VKEDTSGNERFNAGNLDAQRALLIIRRRERERGGGERPTFNAFRRVLQRVSLGSPGIVNSERSYVLTSPSPPPPPSRHPHIA
jgi:hypothetical protein